ncbi:MAG TPA: DinB family protein [Gemmataceae bacterium]|nr:DinB family protein [Gemmataceae bacterium]
MSSLAELIDNYLAGPRTLRQAVAGLSREQLLARPVAGKWSTLEVVCHLADFDPIIAERMKRVLAEERPQLLGADEKRFAAALAYHERNLDEELAIIEQTRSQMARILRTLPPEALGRVGVHNERGPRTLEDLLTGATNHLTHHVKFIADKRRALGLPA